MASIAVSLAIAGASAGLQYLLAPKVKQEPVEKGKMDDIRITSSDYGAFIPRGWGKFRVGGNIIWTEDGVREYILPTPTGGGKGVPQAPATRTYVYKGSYMILVCRGQLTAIRRIWADANLLSNNQGVNNLIFEAEAETLSGGATISTSGTYSGTGWVDNIGNGGKVVFDISAVVDPPTPPPGDPGEVAIPYTRVSFVYKCSSDLTATVTGDVSGASTVSFADSVDTWTSRTVQMAGFQDQIDFENASAAAPDLDYIVVEKYYVIDIIAAKENLQYELTGFVNPDLTYPPDLDDPSEYYNQPITHSGLGIASMTTPLPGEMIRLYLGTDDQTQDSAIVSYLDSKYGSGEGVLRTPAFINQALVMFENRTLKQARPENFTFECHKGSAGVNTILQDLMADVGFTSGDWDLTATASLTQTGFLEHTSGSRRSWIEFLERYHQFRIAEIDGKIKTILNSPVSVVTLTQNDLRAHSVESSTANYDAEITVKDRSQMPREVRVSFMNPDLEYHNETIAAGLFASINSQETREYAFPIIDTRDNARLVAEQLLLTEHAEGSAIEFTSMPWTARYSVGDVITVPIEGVNTAVRIEKQYMSLPMGAVRNQCVAVTPFQSAIYQSDATTVSPLQATQFSNSSFPRNAVVIPIQSQPLNEAERGKLGVYLGICGRGRGTGKSFALYREKDADNYVVQAAIKNPSTAGLTATTLAANPSTPSTEDTTNTVDIWFFDDVELETVTQTDLDNHPTLNLIFITAGDGTGGEWVQFRTAAAQTLEENSPYRSKWRISNLWRERFGTIDEDTSHKTGDYAVLYSRAVPFYELNDSDVGATLKFKAVTSGQGDEVAPITSFVFDGVQSETLTGAGAVSVLTNTTKLALTGAGAVTLAAPSAAMYGMVKTIEMTADNGDVTLALTNCEGQSSGTTAAFDDVGDKLILVAGVSKWTIIKELGITLT